MIVFQIFSTFFLIGLFTIGGGYAMIPMIQDQIVSKGWITSSTLTDFIAISEATPGPFAINIATFVGNSVAGPFGAFMATLGVILPSMIIITIIAILFKKFSKNKYIQGALSGVKPIVVGLILATAIILTIKLAFFANNNISASNYIFDRQSFTLIIILAILAITFKRVNKKSLNPLLILLISGVLGLIIFI